MWDVIKKIKYALFYSLYLPREGLGCEEERRKEEGGGEGVVVQTGEGLRR